MSRKSHSRPRYVPMPDVDLLLQNARGIPPAPKKKREKRMQCPHLQWWEATAPDGARMRKCVMCPRTELYVNGSWIRPKPPTPTPDADAPKV